MNGYYIVKENLSIHRPSAYVYENCLRFDHQRKEAYCPLCHRYVEGSVWEGPYRFFVRSINLSDVLFSDAPSSVLFSENFLNCFYKEGLQGICSVTPCEILYKGQKITQNYYIPKFEYCDSALEYALKKNEERKLNKKLPRCSMCMNPNHEKDMLYFNTSNKLDVFRLYDRHGPVFCSPSFVNFCDRMGIDTITFRNIK